MRRSLNIECVHIWDLLFSKLTNSNSFFFFFNSGWLVNSAVLTQNWLIQSGFSSGLWLFALLDIKLSLTTCSNFQTPSHSMTHLFSAIFDLIFFSTSLCKTPCKTDSLPLHYRSSSFPFLSSHGSWAYPILSNLSLIHHLSTSQLDITYKYGCFLLKSNLTFIIWA